MRITKSMRSGFSLALLLLFAPSLANADLMRQQYSGSACQGYSQEIPQADYWADGSLRHSEPPANGNSLSPIEVVCPVVQDAMLPGYLADAFVVRVNVIDHHPLEGVACRLFKSLDGNDPIEVDGAHTIGDNGNQALTLTPGGISWGSSSTAWGVMCEIPGNALLSGGSVDFFRPSGVLSLEVFTIYWKNQGK